MALNPAQSVAELVGMEANKKRRLAGPALPAKRVRLGGSAGTTEASPVPLKAKFVDEVLARPAPSGRKRPPVRARHPAPFEPPPPQLATSTADRPPGRPQSASEKLQRAVCNGCLWHQECKGLLKDLPTEVPLSFTSTDEYIQTYEPVLQEEARESVRASWGEACEAGAGWSVRITQVEPPTATSVSVAGWGGSVRVDLELLQCRGGGRREGPMPKSVVVLSTFDPPRKAPVEHVNSLLAGKGKKVSGVKGEGEEEKEVGVVAGVVGPVNKDRPMCLSVELFPVCPSHQACMDAPCSRIIRTLQGSKTGWYLVPGGGMITHMREYNALQSIRKLLFANSLLRPEKEMNVNVDKLPRKWPGEVGKGLHESMRKVYDGPQSDAIAMCTAHFAAGSGSHQPEGSVKNGKPLPVMLIQGPPGTGKTHTVRGVLNLWHLVQFQRYYERVIGQFRPPSVEHTSECGIPAGLFDIMRSGEMRTTMKPRILVCAPSNTATDELLERILKEGFFDASGKQYFPNVVRVGAEARTGPDGVPVSEGARAVWVEEMVKTWLNMTLEDWQHRSKESQARRKILTDEIKGLEERMHNDNSTVNDLAGFLIANMEKREKNEIELQRLEIVNDLVCEGHPGMVREAKEKLELSYMDHAEMVFTTLSSTGKLVFSKVKRGFRTVLIDEAAQASEIATLQPLMYGCHNCVMVGDPQQLPATVLSQKAKELNLQRSLFDRLQRAGAPVKVLTIQYRMHPQIRQFPSAYFYNDSLIDGENVIQNQFHEFYNHSLLKPYVFFDVAMGQHERQYSGSLQNHVEAQMATALFKELRDWLVQRMAKLREEGKPPLRSVRVGVITPYKSQRNYIKDTFVKVLGKKIADEVKITTVDSFQGKQCDVIILSCVRASSRSSGVGFVADIRRMNVAITRAKKALWILGNVRTLKCSPSWAALIEDAEKRGCIIHNALAKELFPHQPQFSEPVKKEDPMNCDEGEPGEDQSTQAMQKGDRTKGRGRGGAKMQSGRRKGPRGRGRTMRPEGRNDTFVGKKTGTGVSQQAATRMPQDPRRGVIQSAGDCEKDEKQSSSGSALQTAAAGESTNSVGRPNSHIIVSRPPVNMLDGGKSLSSIAPPVQRMTASTGNVHTTQVPISMPAGSYQMMIAAPRHGSSSVDDWKRLSGQSNIANHTLTWLNDEAKVSALRDAIKRIKEDTAADPQALQPASHQAPRALTHHQTQLRPPGQVLNLQGLKATGMQMNLPPAMQPARVGQVRVQHIPLQRCIIRPQALYHTQPQGVHPGQGIGPRPTLPPSGQRVMQGWAGVVQQQAGSQGSASVVAHGTGAQGRQQSIDHGSHRTLNR